MGYNYTAERSSLFTEQGQVAFMKIRDQARELLRIAGAFQMGKISMSVALDSFQAHACLDRMVELEELLDVSPPGVSGDHRVFIGMIGL
jgi:hypothetical protein